MNHTKITRRIDELGRIVIPKEIRENLNINNGENLEIFVNDQAIVLKKYSKINNYMENINKIIENVSRIFNVTITVFDRDKQISQYPINSLIDISKCYKRDININSNVIGYIYINNNDKNICKQLCDLIVSLIDS